LRLSLVANIRRLPSSISRFYIHFLYAFIIKHHSPTCHFLSHHNQDDSLHSITSYFPTARSFTVYFILHFIVYTFFSVSIYGADQPGYHPTSLLYIFGLPCIPPLFPTFTPVGTAHIPFHWHVLSVSLTIPSLIHPTCLVRTYNQLSSQSSSLSFLKDIL